MRPLFAAVMSLLLLSACATSGSESLSALRHAAPAEDAYQAALADHYEQFAEQKAIAQDWDVADYFAQKGLLATRGLEVLPEEPGAWEQLPPATLGILTEARAKLLEALEVNCGTQPALSAQALVAYDRWLEASANSQDAVYIATEHTRFNEALAKLTQVQAAQPGTDAPVSEPGVAVGKNGATVLYFPFDSDQLGTTAIAAIERLSGSINAQPAKSVNINGHADRAGSEAYNQNLSERRARFVEKALEATGIAKKRLHYFAFGESDPAVPTADGVREPKNRRVEIFLE